MNLKSRLDYATELAPGKVFMDYGPISMVIAAWSNGEPLTGECRRATQVASDCLCEISSQLQYVRLPWRRCPADKLTPVSRSMWEAVSLAGAEDLTPMAAVAGTIADRTADWLASQGATKVFVNNGGDIAIRLAPGEHIKAGVVPTLDASGYSYRVQVTSDARIGGIATSGLGGRSFTRGIVESVTVLAESCAVADAFATSLANASFISHPSVAQIKAAALDPDSDIADLNITTSVGILEEAYIEKSLSQVAAQALPAIKSQRIRGFCAYLQGRKVAMPESVFN